MGPNADSLTVCRLEHPSTIALIADMSPGGGDGERTNPLTVPYCLLADETPEKLTSTYRDGCDDPEGTAKA